MSLKSIPNGLDKLENLKNFEVTFNADLKDCTNLSKILNLTNQIQS